MASVDDPTPSTSNVCSRSGCDIVLKVSENYHNRVYHQETTRIELNDVTYTIHRDLESKKFVCPMCSTGYNDPERLRVHFFF